MATIRLPWREARREADQALREAHEAARRTGRLALMAHELANAAKAARDANGFTRMTREAIRMRKG